MILYFDVFRLAVAEDLGLFWWGRGGVWGRNEGVSE